jgi:GNAT superfamily N-acetyltransferase
MKIREAYFEEIPDIIAKGKAFEKDSKEIKVDIDHATKKFQDMFKSGLVTMLVALNDDDKRIGGLAYLKSPDIYSGEITAIELYWFIHPEYRGGGKMLVDAFEESARGKGCVKAAMIHMVDSFPESLKEFYEKRGYHLTELHYVKKL